MNSAWLGNEEPPLGGHCFKCLLTFKDRLLHDVDALYDVLRQKEPRTNCFKYKENDSLES